MSHYMARFDAQPLPMQACEWKDASECVTFLRQRACTLRWAMTSAWET